MVAIAAGSGGPSPAPTPARLWNRNFLLLWQGQIVSSLGDVTYEIALGFWILAVTGSTALMGTLMAASTVPRILVAPFAGVVVDRSDRRRLLIGMDAIRGVIVIAVGLAALAGQLQVWMVFAAGVVIGACGAFFSPAVSAVFPEIVPREQLLRANSIYSVVQTTSGLVGNSAGGFLYAAIGAPLLFLFNGISYLFSSVLLLFARIPRAAAPPRGQSFFAEMREGFHFGWRNDGVRWLLISAAFLNFFGTIGIVLLLPFFQRTEWLGAGRYGVTMAGFSGGLFLGFVLIAAIKIPPARRFSVFFVGALVMCLAMVLFPLAPVYLLMPVLMFLAGCANAVLNTFVSVAMQLAVPAEMRGKVFSFLGALSQGLTPIAMALAGVLAEFIPLKPLIAGSFVAMLLLFGPLAMRRSFRELIRGEGAVPAADA